MWRVETEKAGQIKEKMDRHSEGVWQNASAVLWSHQVSAALGSPWRAADTDLVLPSH